MSLKATYTPYTLRFKTPARTSRDVLTSKTTYFIKIFDETSPEVFGLGECAVFNGLSPEAGPYYEKILAKACDTINCVDVKILSGWSSIRFGIETAMLDLQNGGRRVIFPGTWTAGETSLTINGLIWMGNADEMLHRIDDKLTAGFKCVKLKIGGIDFESELALLRHIREAFSPATLELRLDANGAFSPANAMERLKRLSEYDIHSIEQPIRQGQWLEMARLCMDSPIPIALDEELIGVHMPTAKERLLDTIRPQYIILKPTLCGGISGSREWMELAAKHNVGWWLTSALESNVGLNAIAQLAAHCRVTIPQGLGTGSLYTNNIPSPVTIHGDRLSYDPTSPWNLSTINF